VSCATSVLLHGLLNGRGGPSQIFSRHDRVKFQCASTARNQGSANAGISEVSCMFTTRNPPRLPSLAKKNAAEGFCSTGSVMFVDLTKGQPESLQANLIMPEPTPFLDARKFPVCSIIRPTETTGAAAGAVKAFTDDGLFIGRRIKAFLTC